MKHPAMERSRLRTKERRRARALSNYKSAPESRKRFFHKVFDPIRPLSPDTADAFVYMASLGTMIEKVAGVGDHLVRIDPPPALLDDVFRQLAADTAVQIAKACRPDALMFVRYDGEKLAITTLEKSDYTIGIDPAHGRDVGMAVLAKREPDGSITYVDAQEIPRAPE